MQYVRNISDSVSTAWNSINPATLSGAIDVIVVERQDGTLCCSPFHVRFGKFSLLRPYEKKVEFRVNAIKQDYSMKLGEGGEAFFVFETTDSIPESLQTSPLVSPADSPPLHSDPSAPQLQEPDPLELNSQGPSPRRPLPHVLHGPARSHDSDTLASFPPLARSTSGDWPPSTSPRPHSDATLSIQYTRQSETSSGATAVSDRSHSPPPLPHNEAIQRAHTLSKGLSAANIPSHVTRTGDLMLEMAGFKGSEQDMLRAEVLARKILSEALDGDYDIGALFGFDEEGNLWIYSSEEAKQAAMARTIESSLRAHCRPVEADASSDPGYQSDGSDMATGPQVSTHRRSESDDGPTGTIMKPSMSYRANLADPTTSYAKTLRLTSDQLKALDLKPGENSMSFTVNRATCCANMYLWKEETPVVVSDIDGTITKSDALGHVLNMIGRDWTHLGVAKLYSDIALNGYNIMYLTSRSVGQADTTRAYLKGIVQDRFRMPPGPTILSPDRTMAALRREIYLRKPHIFKMATLRDISNLYGPGRRPFYAGFGNRLTDQISYRTVHVPRNRIFTINSNAEVSLDLLSLNKLKMSYCNINEVVDHYFPPVGTLVPPGGEEFTDFMYWREEPLDPDEFTASESEGDDAAADEGSAYSGDEEDDAADDDGLGESYISRESMDAGAVDDGLADSLELAEEEEMSDGSEDEDYDEDDNGMHESVATNATESHFVAEDVSAELITGLKMNLGLGRDTEPRAVRDKEPGCPGAALERLHDQHRPSWSSI
ncbi:hypothetical protein CDD82_759 [Ophiocordyceps australis]|uniref:LNS2/PITP domain-containing protein n=1 Tax=Ophiocordyceps australis TaxID=1399860 RepID=A0A2C5ZUD5_9HYPO|nr:hypothetical protein CDD82_759 [Ophiocordyceps australis]